MKHSEAPYSDKRKNFRFWLNRKPDLRWEFVEKTLHSGQIFYIKTNNSGSPGKIQVSVVKDYMGSSGGLTFASCPGLWISFQLFPFCSSLSKLSCCLICTITIFSPPLPPLYPSTAASPPSPSLPSFLFSSIYLLPTLFFLFLLPPFILYLSASNSHSVSASSPPDHPSSCIYYSTIFPPRNSEGRGGGGCKGYFSTGKKYQMLLIRVLKPMLNTLD